MDIVEVGPRDGLQNEATVLDTATKVAMIGRLLDAGARRIEACSFVHPDRVPQMADAEAVMDAVPRRVDVSYIGLVLNHRGLRRAIDAGVDEVNVVLGVTDTFSRRNQGMPTAAMLEQWLAIGDEARAAGLRTTLTLSVAFGCPYEGEVAPDDVTDLVEGALMARPDELALADTIGVAVPAQVVGLVNRVQRIDDRIDLRAHFHNTRNTGYANAIAAIAAGVVTLDASVGGIGGCPFAPNATGNIATEDLVYLLEREGIATGLSLTALSDTARWVGDALGKQPPGLLSRAGPFPPS